jgi:hypothetical protein
LGFGLLGAILAAIGLLWVLGCQDGIRNVGTVLQVLGVVTVYLNLRGTRILFGRPNSARSIVAWWARRPRLQPKGRILAAAAIVLGADTMSARATLGLGANATIEERVALLEKKYTSLFNEVGQLDSRLKTETSELETKLKAEAIQRDAGDKTIIDRVEEALAKPSTCS